MSHSPGLLIFRLAGLDSGASPKLHRFKSSWINFQISANCESFWGRLQFDSHRSRSNDNYQPALSNDYQPPLSDDDTECSSA